MSPARALSITSILITLWHWFYAYYRSQINTFQGSLALPVLQRYWQQPARILSTLIWAPTLNTWEAFSDLIWSKGDKVSVWIVKQFAKLPWESSQDALLQSFSNYLYNSFHEVQRQKWKKKQETESKYLAYSRFLCPFIMWRKSIYSFQTDIWRKWFLAATNLE